MVENRRTAEGDLEIREDSNGEELVDCKLYSPARARPTRKNRPSGGRNNYCAPVCLSLSLLLALFAAEKGEGGGGKLIAMPIAT